MKRPSAFYLVIVMKNSLAIILSPLLPFPWPHQTLLRQTGGNQDNDIHFRSGAPYYDVVAFGAKGDNSTLDTAAVLNAYTTACSGGGGIVFFPANHTFKFCMANVDELHGMDYFQV